MRTTNKEWDRLVCVSADFTSPVQLWVRLLMSNLFKSQEPERKGDSD